MHTDDESNQCTNEQEREDYSKGDNEEQEGLVCSNKYTVKGGRGGGGRGERGGERGGGEGKGRRRDRGGRRGGPRGRGKGEGKRRLEEELVVWYSQPFTIFKLHVRPSFQLCQTIFPHPQLPL